MSEPESLVLVVLREMRADMNARFAAVDARFAALEDRLEAIEKRLDVMHRNGERSAARVHRPPRDGGAYHGELRGRNQP
jgi:hypothetical protein